MRDLLQCRDDIDRIDTQVLELLRERMEVANDIAEYKLVHNQSITDAKRELLKLKTLRQKAEDLGLPPSYISDVYKLIMSNTCAIERHYIVAKANNQGIVRDTSVSYLGNTGSYSHVAARKYLEGFKGKVEATGCPGFSEIVSMVETGKTEYGVLPIENSSSGSINDVIEELLGGLRSTMTYVGAWNLKNIPKQRVFYKVQHQLNQTYESTTIGK